MSILFQDLRFAVRQLLKSPGFTAAAVLTLAIGIGANAAIFSMMDALVLRPLAVPDMDRVMVVGEQQESQEYQPVALANYQDWVRQNRSFAELAARQTEAMVLTGAGDAAHIEAAVTTPNFFTVLRTTPALGRTFNSSDAHPGQDAVAVLKFGFWQRHFAADPQILGRQIELDQRKYTIVGVMPKSLQYPSTADIFLPLAPTTRQLANRTEHSFFVIGRLRDGVTKAQAQQEMHILAEQEAQAFPASNEGRDIKVDLLLDQVNGGLTRLYFRLVLGATLFVLLVVCANVANLQFARGVARRPEIAMRSALGASHTQLMRQLLTENILLGLVGAAGGLGVAELNLRISAICMPERVAHYLAGWSNISLNGRALAYSLVLALATGIVSGILPAIEALRVNLVEQLKSVARGSIGTRAHRLRSLFAVAQIALAIALVIGASLMAKGMWSMLHFADIYEPNKALTFGIDLPRTRYDTPQKLSTFYADSLEKLRALPGVKHAEVALSLPYADQGWLDDVRIEKRPVVPGKFQSALHLPVSNSYFSSLGIPIVDGRAFNSSDQVGALPVAIVSQKFVLHYFPDENPIGHRIRMGAERGSTEPWLTIVGIAKDVNYSWWDQTPPETVYMSAVQVPPQNATFTVLTDGDPVSLGPSVRKAMAGVDPLVPLDAMQTYKQLLHESLTGLLYAAANLMFDALVALLLAAIGIFAVMANQVAERTREIGVRVAMGADRQDVLGMVLRRATWLTAVGIGTGLIVAFALARVAANLLAGVRPDDPLVFGTITATVSGVALLASWIPARRAARVDPMVALRDQ